MIARHAMVSRVLYLELVILVVLFTAMHRSTLNAVTNFLLILFELFFIGM